jgi:DNA ligase (NAD+)
MTEEILAPTACPECSQPIEEYTEPRSLITTHWCTNVECPGRLKALLTYVASRDCLEIDALGPELAGLLVSKGYVTDLPSLFEFTNDAAEALETMTVPEFSQTMVLKHGLPASAVISMVRSIETAKTAGWDRWIATFSIHMIGKTLGKVLAEKLELTSDDMGTLPAIMLKLETMPIEGFGPHKKAELLSTVVTERFADHCARLHAAGIRPRALSVAKVDGAPLAGMAFVVTGEFPSVGTREMLSARLVSLGAVFKSGVTKKCSHLIVGEEPGASKTRKAAELGIPYLGAAWLEETFDKYGFPRVGSEFIAEEAE